MPWDNSPEKRRRDAKVYGDPIYRRNRAFVLRQAGGRCQCTGECGRHEGDCGRRDRPLQTDHIIPVSEGGGPGAGNLRAVCSGKDSCHAAITAQQGGGYRAHNRRADPEPRRSTQW
jgi:5-methylcytosine-specific restriction endonuclease McrA